MSADASIYGQVRQQPATEGALDQYAKVTNLKQLMGQGKLQDLQTQKLTRDLAEEEAYGNVLRNAPTGATLESLLPEAIKASPTRGIALQNTVLDRRQKEAGLRHTEAQTGEITAGHIATGMAAVLKGGGSDDSIAQLAQTMTEAGMPADKVQASTARMLALPPEQRVTAALAGAVQHKNGIEALKLMFPDAKMTDAGGTVVPTNTSTLPGGAAPGSTVTGGVAIPKTLTPGEVLTDERTRSEGKANRGVTMRGQDKTDARMRDANGILEGGGLTPENELMAKGIAEGKIAPLSGMALSRPGGRAVMGRVMELNPEYSAKDYATGAKAEKDFASGKLGSNVRSFNVSISHLETLDTLADALHNNNMQIVNKVGNEFAKQTGQAAPVNFEAAKKIVGDEIVKAIVGSGGGVADREEAAKTISAASSPAQLKGVINTYKELMKGQLHGLRQQYETSTGRKDFDRFLSESAKKTDKGAGGPAAGTVQDGYKFKGGDPAKRENWEKV